MLIEFPTDWIKANQNVKQGDMLRFLNEGEVEKGKDNFPRFIFAVAIIRDGSELDTKKFSLNKTNATSTMSVYGRDSKKWVGKEMMVNIIKARNPQTNALVDSILLTDPNSEAEGHIIED